MNTINFTLNKKIKPYTCVMVDGQPIKPKFKRGIGKVEYTTENNEVELSFLKVSRFDTKLWWLLEMFYFIISIFGIFDMRFDKNEYIANCKIKLAVKEKTNVKLHLPFPKNGAPVLKVESDTEVTQESNVYEVDKTAQKKKKILNISKIITFVATIILLVVFLLI